MAEQKTILVMGATGAQYGNMARYLLEGGKYAVRCQTCHPESEAANALHRAGGRHFYLRFSAGRYAAGRRLGQGCRRSRRVVAALLDRRDEYLDRVAGVVGDDRPPAEFAALLSEAIGRTVTYQHIPREAYAVLAFPAADDLAAMLEFTRRFVPNRAADLVESRRLYSHMQTFEEWTHAHRDRLRQCLGLKNDHGSL